MYCAQGDRTRGAIRRSKQNPAQVGQGVAAVASVIHFRGD